MDKSCRQCSHQDCARARRDKRRAVARLNAAAPDMLAALKSAHLTVVGMATDQQLEHPITIDTLAKIDAAIAKAEGKRV